MDSTLKPALVLMLLGVGFTFLSAFPVEDDFQHCEIAVKKWASSPDNLESKHNKHKLKDLLFFLHVPRTGGRTYFHCFLRKLYSNSLECPRSYDKLHFDPGKPNCRLLVTHDDYSVTSKLPKQKTSVVTILRNPIDRVFSTYEFSVEVAARFLVHPTLKSALKMTAQLRTRTRGVSTLNIWPWKYLVPWMREDLFSRRDARKAKGPNYITSNDSYDMADVVMPLHEYINDPIAKDIIHNGATFQVTGLTNNSYLSDAHKVRRCVQKYQTLSHYVLEVAKRRLDEMLYVGLTEHHRQSATMFANVVGAQVISQMTPLSSSIIPAPGNTSEQSLLSHDSEIESNHYQNNASYQNASEIIPTGNVETTNENMTVEELMKVYGDCITTLRTSQSHRRTASLSRISPANFTKKARLQVSKAVLQQIISLNSLDVELYEHAQNIFVRQPENIIQTMVSIDGQESRLIKSFGIPSWRALSVSMFVVSFLVVAVFVNARRRTSKVKI